MVLELLDNKNILTKTHSFVPKMERLMNVFRTLLAFNIQAQLTNKVHITILDSQTECILNLKN